MVGSSLNHCKVGNNGVGFEWSGVSTSGSVSSGRFNDAFSVDSRNSTTTSALQPHKSLKNTFQCATHLDYATKDPLDICPHCAGFERQQQLALQERRENVEQRLRDMGLTNTSSSSFTKDILADLQSTLKKWTQQPPPQQQKPQPHPQQEMATPYITPSTHGGNASTPTPNTDNARHLQSNIHRIPSPPLFVAPFDSDSLEALVSQIQGMQRTQDLQDYVLYHKEQECKTLRESLDLATQETALLQDKLHQQEQFKHELKLIELAATQQRNSSGASNAKKSSTSSQHSGSVGTVHINSNSLVPTSNNNNVPRDIQIKPSVKSESTKGGTRNTPSKPIAALKPPPEQAETTGLTPPIPVNVNFPDPSDSRSIGNTVESSTYGEDRQKVNRQVVLDPYGKRGTYTGFFLRSTGMPHGSGCMVYHKDKRTYDGEWRHGRRHGFGHATFPNGDKYHGEHQYDERHGRGRYEWKDGRVYEGMFWEDKRHGHGIFTWPSGGILEAEFRNGRPTRSKV